MIKMKRGSETADVAPQDECYFLTAGWVRVEETLVVVSEKTEKTALAKSDA